MCVITGETQPPVLSHFSPFPASGPCSKYSPAQQLLIVTPTGHPAFGSVSATKRGGESDLNIREWALQECQCVDSHFTQAT